MGMLLMIHPGKCTGCQICTLACSLQHGGEIRPKASRVHVYTWEREGFSVPLMCQQCEDAPCIAVCQPKAMHRNPVSGQVDLDSARCIGCKMCVQACPFGNAAWDSRTAAILKCDNCNGAPACVRSCPEEALAWVEDTVSAQSRKRDFAARLKSAFQEG